MNRPSDSGKFFNFYAVIGESKVESVERGIKAQPLIVRDTGEELVVEVEMGKEFKDHRLSRCFSSAFDALLNTEHVIGGKTLTYRTLPHVVYPSVLREGFKQTK